MNFLIYGACRLSIKLISCPFRAADSIFLCGYQGTMGGSPIFDDLADQTFDGQIPMLSSSSHQPDRPDQPECHDFVNTGNCKYGADCKYYHPRNKVAPTTSNLLGPLGLPLRPVSIVAFTSMFFDLEQHSTVLPGAIA